MSQRSLFNQTTGNIFYDAIRAVYWGCSWEDFSLFSLTIMMLTEFIESSNPRDCFQEMRRGICPRSYVVLLSDVEEAWARTKRFVERYGEA
jgi:hypothetical protein